MIIAIGVIEIHREYWIKKRFKLIDRIAKLQKEGKENKFYKAFPEVKVVDEKSLLMVLDTIQEVISDLSDMIDSLRCMKTYEESCSNLINNINE